MATRPLLHSPTEDYREELIKEILLSSNHITLNKNSPTRLLPNQTQQFTVPEMNTASANLHNFTIGQIIHSLKSNLLLLLTALSIHHKTTITSLHFIETIPITKGNQISFRQHVEDLISYRPHTTKVHETSKHLIKAIFDADRLFILKEITTIQITLTYPCIFASLSIKKIRFPNKIDQVHKSLLLNNHINKQIHEPKTNTWKQDLDQK